MNSLFSAVIQPQLYSDRFSIRLVCGEVVEIVYECIVGMAALKNAYIKEQSYRD